MDQLIASKTVVSREVNEVKCFRNDSTAFRSAGHGDASSSLKLQKSLITKQTKRAKHRVGVDFQYSSEIFCRRQTLSGQCFTIGDRPTNFRGNLVM